MARSTSLGPATVANRVGGTAVGILGVAAIVWIAAGLVAVPVAAQSGPTADLDVSPNPAHPDQSVRLDGRNSSAPNATIETCEFDLDGDGSYEVQSADCVVDERYTTVGTVGVGLRVTTTAGAVATDTVALEVVENEPPTAEMYFDPRRPFPGDGVAFSGVNSSDVDGLIVEYSWELPSGNATGERVTESFEAPGTYIVGLTVRDDDGATAAVTRSVTVEANVAPTADLVVVTENPTVGEPIQFDAAGSVDPDGVITAYHWDFDDGAVDRRTRESLVTKTREAPGEYRVTVEVVDDRGGIDRATVEYAVSAGPETATAAPTQPVTPLAVGGVEGTDLGFVSQFSTPITLLVVLVALALVGILLATRRSDIFARGRDRLDRGDVRRRIGGKAAGTTVKTVSKQVVKRFGDLVEAVGDVVGESIERVGRAIKLGSRRLAAWLRRLGS
jgi:PKD repeat protein